MTSIIKILSQILFSREFAGISSEIGGHTFHEFPRKGVIRTNFPDAGEFLSFKLAKSPFDLRTRNSDMGGSDPRGQKIPLIGHGTLRLDPHGNTFVFFVI